MRRLLAPVLQKQETECLFEAAKASPAVFGYRNKMEFTFGDEVKDGPFSLGNFAVCQGLFCRTAGEGRGHNFLS